MKLFVKWFLPFVVALSLSIQGCHYSSVLLSTKSDVAVFAGTILWLASVLGLVSFILSWYRVQINKVVEFIREF